MPTTTNIGSNGCPIARDLSPQLISTNTLKALGRETRKHPASQVQKLARNIERFGFVLPVVIDEQLRVIAGWGLVLAAQRLELPEVPAVTINNLCEAELRALRLSLNRLGEDSDWNQQELVLEFSEILELDADFELELSGFEMGETDLLLAGDIDDEDVLPVSDDGSAVVSQPGDAWQMGDHRIVCADALKSESYSTLLGDDQAQMVFTDPPYNVEVDGNVCGSGRVKHAEFAMASGEMSSAEFTEFLKTSLGLAAAHSSDGALHFVCMDWRHMSELQVAGEDTYSELKNLCIWSKTNGGMGSLYRSQHELVFVYKYGTAPHINNVQLGKHGRNRTNVWTYPGQSSFGGSGHSKLVLHPTVKPVALIADAIRDCSNRGGIILDPFGGSGTTLIAAERTGRKAKLIEYEPRYVDVTVKRWQALTGRKAINKKTGHTFDEVEQQAANKTGSKPASNKKNPPAVSTGESEGVRAES